MKQSMSISHGSPGGHAHNVEKEYREGLSNVDPRRTELNEILIDRDLEEVYQDLFRDALDAYNEKQTRSDRRIENYLDKIRSGDQEKPVYELVVQIGNKDTNSAMSEANRIGSSQIYREWLSRFEREFPQFRIQQAAVHQDEATPHLHVAYVPFSTGNKRGLETKNSLSGAMKQMGFQDVRNVNERLHEILQEVASEHGIDRLDMGCHRAHMSVRDFKAMFNTVDQESEYQYRDNPALLNLLQKQNDLIEELIQENENQRVAIDELCEGIANVGALGRGLNDLKEQAAEARAASKALNPVYEAAREAVSGFKAFIAQVPQWWRDNILNPVSDRLRASREEERSRSESNPGQESLVSRSRSVRAAAEARSGLEDLQTGRGSREAR